MSSWSSYKDQQTLTESWRLFLKESRAPALGEASPLRWAQKKAVGIKPHRLLKDPTYHKPPEPEAEPVTEPEPVAEPEAAPDPAQLIQRAPLLPAVVQAAKAQKVDLEDVYAQDQRTLVNTLTKLLVKSNSELQRLSPQKQQQLGAQVRQVAQLSVDDIIDVEYETIPEPRALIGVSEPEEPTVKDAPPRLPGPTYVYELPDDFAIAGASRGAHNMMWDNWKQTYGGTREQFGKDLDQFVNFLGPFKGHAFYREAQEKIEKLADSDYLRGNKDYLIGAYKNLPKEHGARKIVRALSGNVKKLRAVANAILTKVTRREKEVEPEEVAESILKESEVNRWQQLAGTKKRVI